MPAQKIMIKIIDIDIGTCTDYQAQYSKQLVVAATKITGMILDKTLFENLSVHIENGAIIIESEHHIGDDFISTLNSAIGFGTRYGNVIEHFIANPYKSNSDNESLASFVYSHIVGSWEIRRPLEHLSEMYTNYVMHRTGVENDADYDLDVEEEIEDDDTGDIDLDDVEPEPVQVTEPAQTNVSNIGRRMSQIFAEDSSLSAYYDMYKKSIEGVVIPEDWYRSVANGDLMNKIHDWNGNGILTGILDPVKNDPMMPSSANSTSVQFNERMAAIDKRIAESENTIVTLKKERRAMVDSRLYMDSYINNVRNFMIQVKSMDIVKGVDLVLRDNRPKTAVVHLVDMTVPYEGAEKVLSGLSIEVNLRIFTPSNSSRMKASSGIHILASDPISVMDDYKTFSVCPHARAFKDATGNWNLAACFGDYEDCINQAIMENAYEDLIRTIAEFIRSYNENDCFGESIKLYPNA